MANEFIIRKGFKSKEDSQITGSISLSGSFKDQESSSGTVGQVLSSTVSGSQWVDAADSGAITGTGTTGTLTKWTTGGEVIGDSIITEGSSKINISGNVDIIKTTSDVAGELRIGGTLASDNLPFGKINFANTNAANSQVNDILAYIAGEKIISSNTAHLTFATSNSSAPVERMRITSGGNVGIGTASPSAKLHIQGTNSSSGGIKIQNSGGNPYAIYSDNNDLLFTNGNGTSTALTISYAGVATFSGNTSANVVTARDNMFVGAGQFYIGAENSSTNDTYRQSVGSGIFKIQSNESGTWTDRLTISSGGDATFAKSIIFADGAAFAGAASIRRQSNALILTGGSSGFYFNDDTNAVSNLVIASTGQTTITCTSSQPILTINGTDSYSWLQTQVSGVNKWAIGNVTVANGTDLEFYSYTGGNGTRLTVGSGGHIIQDTTSATSTYFQVRSVGTTRGYFGVADALLNAPTTNSQFCIRSEADFAIATGGGTRRLIIDSGGDVKIPNQVMIRRTTDFDSTSIYCLQVGDASLNNHTPIVCTVASTSSRNQIVFSNNSSNIVGRITTQGSSTSYNTTSDYRLKENVTPITDALSRVNQLKPSRFNFIIEANKTVDGFLAHEVSEIIPEAISGEKDALNEDGTPNYQGIDQSKIVPLLTAAIQEQQTIIESQKSLIDGLTTRIETLEG